MNLELFGQLRKANIFRLPQFKNKQGELAHSEPDGSDWSLDDWLVAVEGEIGELANVQKKFKRGDFDRAEFDLQAGKEIADVVIYLDIYAFQFGLDLPSPKTLDYFLKADTIAQAMVRISATFGNLAETQLRCDGMPPEKLLRNLKPHCEKLLAWLDHYCFLINVNFEEAIVSKFNEVSERVGATVFLSNRGFYFANRGENHGL